MPMLADSMTFSSEAALQAWALATTWFDPWPRFAVPAARASRLYVENSGIVELKKDPGPLQRMHSWNDTF